ncbi:MULTISPECIES: hypothetical protein [Hafnia]|uniref:hypothetical protein n=1 Tax=Hafnia TaxID=568 RepID=UPI0005BE37B4|nr:MULTISPECIES: hypothetical protein [Hafnia]MDU1193430.1 hypothetical protein [Enterobacteriaceae bacterium]MCV9379004.1 hypothetical protein [Hafnia alvei]MDU1245525.1 hypothetical protein [Enterobacteriaceae bacterium]MDX6844914.1 hypothetical protein [Hafnia alvei]RLR09593.1 hypothetical protein EAE69_11700 [Hafnia alvei ATCC 13337]
MNINLATISKLRSLHEETSNLFGLAATLHEIADEKLDADYLNFVGSLGALRQGILKLSTALYELNEEVSKHE